MGSGEEKVRREVVARVLGGEAARGVAADVGRSDRWVRKWVARYDPADEDWASDRSRAPHRVANRTAEESERVVVEIRRRLMDDPWAQVGAVAIAWEMAKLGLEPLQVWTIDRILRRAGVPKRRAPNRYLPKGTPYPQGPRLLGPNACQEIDLVGPRHLEGAVPFYALNAVDLGRRRAGIEILPSKEEPEVAAGLLRLWSRLGLPKVAKFDNGQTIQGQGRHLAMPVRTCAALGVRVRFIPFAEPWRNPVIEHFNDVFDKRFFRTERFHNLAHLASRALTFEAFHNTHHRYSALKGATPQEWEAKLRFQPRFPDPEAAATRELPRHGQVEFIRLIRSNHQLRILGVNIPMPDELVYRYLTATLHLRTQRLVVECAGLPWRTELHFPLSP